MSKIEIKEAGDRSSVPFGDVTPGSVFKVDGRVYQKLTWLLPAVDRGVAVRLDYGWVQSFTKDTPVRVAKSASLEVEW